MTEVAEMGGARKPRPLEGNPFPGVLNRMRREHLLVLDDETDAELVKTNALRFVLSEEIEEALQRGATELQIVQHLHKQQAQLKLPSTLESQPFKAHLCDFSYRLEGLPVDVGRLIAEYNNRVQNEFNGFSPETRWAFVPDGTKQNLKAKKGRKKITDEEFGNEAHAAGLIHYRILRPAYYQNGYTNPEAIFKDIHPGKLLGTTIGAGANKDFLAAIDKLANVLDGLLPGLAKLAADQLREVGNRIDVEGFEPRLRMSKTTHYPDGRPKLSNHAFGCAVDVNATFNPQIKDEKLIKLLKEITGYDFALPIVPVDPKQSDLERILLVHENEKIASDRLKKFLGKYLPLYKQKKSGALPPTEKETQDGISKIEQFLAIEKPETIERWARYGIYNLPALLVVATKAVGLQWGGDYKGSQKHPGTKDSMHFELTGGSADAPYLKADSPPRPLQDLLNLWGISSSQPR